MFAIVTLMVSIGMTAQVFAGSGLQQLQGAPAPKFETDHNLIPLSTWGPGFELDVRKELCENWGYCLQFGRLRPAPVKKLKDADSVQSKVCKLAKADPENYPLHVVTAPAFSIRHYRDELPPETWCRDGDGGLIKKKKIFSPEAPDETFEMIAEFEADMIKKVLEKAPIAVLTNGGEYGLSTVGHHRKYWKQDPRVMKAKGETGWFEYISRAKARQEMIITGKLRELVPERELYIYYHTSGCPHRGRYGGWWRWAWDYEYMQDVSDIPNSSIYWGHYNDGWFGSNDMLTQALNATGQNLAAGDRYSYNWMCPGWPSDNRPDPPMSKPERYMGYLKCYYTAGMIGGVAGYFSYDEPSNWMWQLMCLGRVHALFSHLEDFVRNSDLLPGSKTHVWSDERPAYELPTDTNGEVRVVARRHQQRNAWLIAAWAAKGDARDVQVQMPQLGQVSVNARPAGAVYRATLEDGQAELELVDTKGKLPTQGF